MPEILSIAEAGMRNSLHQLDTISNNMANMNTQAYKREIYLNRGFQSHMPDASTPADMAATGASSSMRDYSPAPLKFTGSSLNVAIEGDGYFQLETPQGILLTRDGQFQINEQGKLVSAQGWPVVLKNEMTFESPDFKILGDGTVVVSDKNQSQLDIVTADPKALEMVGPGIFRSSAMSVEVAKPSYVRQGYIETSNVNSLNEMVNLMTVTRHFEMSQQLMRAYDGMMDSVVNTLGEF